MLWYATSLLCNKEPMILVTTFFEFMISIWWPNGVWKWPNFKNIAFLELPNQTHVCFDMPQEYSTKKKTGGGHDHISLKHEHKNGPDHNLLLSSTNNIQHLGASYISRIH